MENAPPSDRESEWRADASLEFLMAEYGHVSEAWLANEEAGERRLNVFVGLIAAVTAALGLAFEGFGGDLRTLGLVASGSSAVLLVFGLATLRRIMERNLAGDEYLEALGRMRAYIAERDRAMLHVMAFAPDRKPRPPRRTEVWKLGKAGFLEITALTNCLLSAALLSAGLAAAQARAWLWLTAALLGAATGWWLQMIWAIRVYREERSDRIGERAAVLKAWGEREA